jgi:hypothetical protein
MIGMIYITYLATYIGVLINVDRTNETSFLLGNTSSVKNAAAKGYTLLLFTMTFLGLLVWSILKTVFTNPGYFPEPIDLEYKLITNSLENLFENNSHKCCESKNKQNEELSARSLTLELGKEIPAKSKKGRDYANLEEEFEFINDSYTKKIKNTKYITEKTPKERNLTKEPLDNKNNKNINNLNKSNRSNKSTESHNLIVNFTTSVTEGPLNCIEYTEYKRSIDKFYDSFSKKIDGDLKSQIINFESKSNEEIIETNKIKLMEKKREKKNEKISIAITDLYKGVDISRLNQCGTCQRIKMERSHHCKMCQKCVLKMDHHCPWLANCIGFFNYKYFCLVHFYGSISSGLIFLTFWETIANFHLNYNTLIFECVFVDFVFMTNFALMAFLMWLLWVNLKLVINGETIIEQSDRERFPSSKSFNVYDMGYSTNFTNIFGEKWYTWFIPAFANLKGNGLMFETKKNFFIDQ